jgi:4'-phosphopantetheinyl transferase
MNTSGAGEPEMAQQQAVAMEADFLESFEAHAPVQFSSMPGMTVFVFSVEKSLGHIEALTALLSEAELARAAEINHTNRRNAYIASRGLLRATLTGFAKGVVAPAAWEFGLAAFGKPYVTSPEGIGMRFSLSYTTTLIAIAVSQKFELGVDIEAVPAGMSEVPWQVLTQAERQFIRTLPEPEQFAEFLNIWTIKEAYTKYLGVGASLDFRKVEVSTREDLATARTEAETRMPDPTVKQRTIEVGWQTVILAVAAAKTESGTYVAPAGEAVTLLRRV